MMEAVETQPKILRPLHNGSFMDRTESLRGAKENDWSWQIRRKFIQFHSQQQPDMPLDLLNSYSWTLINTKTLGCRYDTEHIANLNVMALDAGIEDELNSGGPTPEIAPYVPDTSNRRGRGGRAPNPSRIPNQGGPSAAYVAGATAAIKCFPSRNAQPGIRHNSHSHNESPSHVVPAPFLPPVLPSAQLVQSPRRAITVTELEAQMMRNVVRISPPDKERALAMAFIKTRPQNELTIKLQGRLTEKEASRIFQETVDANKAYEYLFAKETSLPKRNRQNTHESVVIFHQFRLLRRQGSNAKEAKSHACYDALLVLSEYFPTIEVSESEGAPGVRISRAELMTETALDSVRTKAVCSTALLSLKDSYGYKLLRRMGWKEGCGLGVKENGILYPVSTMAASIIYNTHGRPGLGYREISEDCLLVGDRCEDLCQMYLTDAILLHEITLSSEFTIAEREVIHSVCEKYRLSHTSTGSGENRHVVVRLKWTIEKLKEELIRVGGAAGRYRLLMPKQPGS